MTEKKDKIVKRGVIAQRYKYTISESQVVTIKGVGELENNDEPLQFRFPAKNVVIAEGITAIGHLVFWQHYNLHTIQIPDTVTKINGSAFSRCYSLKAPSLPDSITELGRGAFAECHGFDKIVLPHNLDLLYEVSMQRYLTFTLLPSPSSPSLLIILSYSFGGFPIFCSYAEPSSTMLCFDLWSSEFMVSLVI